MASTNKTTNYELSQFIGTDKPAWLTDYNGDMGKIDTAIKNAADAATVADGKGDTANTNIGTLANLTTTAKTNLVAAINEVDSNADTAQNTATSAADTATQAGATALAAKNATDGLTTYLNLTNFTEITTTANWSKTLGGGTINSIKLYIARNAAGTVAKVYGNINCSGVTTGSTGKVVYSGDTGLRPDTDIDIYMAGFLSSSNYGLGNITLTIKTDGKLEIQGYQDAAGNASFRMLPCMYFLKDFGDSPE